MPINMLASRWHRWMLRRRQYGGGADILDALYERADPWNLCEPDDQARFVATNALIAQHFPRAASLIEVGCGEGAQTGFLLAVADHVTGIDISPLALARARESVPAATFHRGEVTAFAGTRHDVATLCEVLYYMDDPGAALSAAQRIADHVIVTIFEQQARRLETLFRDRQWRELSSIRQGRKCWRVYIWQRHLDSARPAFLL